MMGLIDEDRANRNRARLDKIGPGSEQGLWGGNDDRMVNLPRALDQHSHIQFDPFQGLSELVDEITKVNQHKDTSLCTSASGQGSKDEAFSSPRRKGEIQAGASLLHPLQGEPIGKALIIA